VGNPCLPGVTLEVVASSENVTPGLSFGFVLPTLAVLAFTGRVRVAMRMEILG